jgi:hypothetical protein
MRGKELLTEEQREEIMQIPSDRDWDLQSNWPCCASPDGLYRILR